MVDPKFMSVLFVVLASSNTIKRSGLSYGNKILISFAITFILSFFIIKATWAETGIGFSLFVYF